MHFSVIISIHIRLCHPSKFWTTFSSSWHLDNSTHCRIPHKCDRLFLRVFPFAGNYGIWLRNVSSKLFMSSHPSNPNAWTRCLQS